MHDPAPIASAYDSWAVTYDSDTNRTRDLDQRVLAELLAERLATAAPRRLGFAIEAGCGTGKNTERLAAAAERVLALDVSPGMLAIARAKVRAGNVVFARTDLTAPWPVADGAADFATFDLVLEHVRELPPVFAHASRALRPGGLLAVTELHPARQYEGKQAHFQRGAEVVAVPAFVHHLSDYLRAAAAAGFALHDLREHWHLDDEGRPPRLLCATWRRA